MEFFALSKFREVLHYFFHSINSGAYAAPKKGGLGEIFRDHALLTLGKGGNALFRSQNILDLPYLP